MWSLCPAWVSGAPMCFDGLALVPGSPKDSSLGPGLELVEGALKRVQSDREAIREPTALQTRQGVNHRCVVAGRRCRGCRLTYDAHQVWGQ